MPSGGPHTEGERVVGTEVVGVGAVDTGMVGSGTMDTGEEGAGPRPGADCSPAEGWLQSFMRFTTLSDSFGKK